jgi:hypothetical protein
MTAIAYFLLQYQHTQVKPVRFNPEKSYVGTLFMGGFDALIKKPQ